MKAAIQASQDVIFNVTRNWPTHATFKVVDTGKGRNVNQLLQMQGVKYTTRRTGVVNTIIQICAGGSSGGSTRRGLSIHEVERITHLFAKSLDPILEMRSHAANIGNPTPIVGCFVFLHDKLPDQIWEFAEDFFTLRFSETHPARALKRWVDNNSSRDIRATGIRCTLNALHAYVEKLPFPKAHPGQVGLEWARKLQSKRVEQVKAIVGCR